MLAKGWDYVVIGAGAAGCVVAGRKTGDVHQR
jgi:choline dehydrogenase-like flavoprotein